MTGSRRRKRELLQSIRAYDHEPLLGMTRSGGLLGPITGTAAAASGIDVGGFDFSVSLLLITVLFIAGRQPILSAVLGSVLLVIIPSYATGATAVKWNPIIFGSLAIVAALFGGRSLVEWFSSSRRLRERSTSPSPQAERRLPGELVLEPAR